MSCRLALFITLATLLSAKISVAQEVSPSPVTESAKPFDSVEATDALLATVPADQRAKSNAYFEGGYWLLLWNFLVAAAISIFLLASGLSARLRDFAERQAKSKTLQVIIYSVGYILIVAALSFPLLLYQDFIREHQYGFATQSFRSEER